MRDIGLGLAIAGFAMSAGGWWYVDSWAGIVGAMSQAVGASLLYLRA
jgi:hypothetical protein